MKASLVFGCLFAAVCIFQVGAVYGAYPYRQLAFTGVTELELARVTAEQLHASLIVTFVALALILLSSAFLIADLFRRKRNSGS